MVKDDQSLSDPLSDIAVTDSAESMSILSDPGSWQSTEDSESAAQSGADDNFKLRDGSRIGVISGGPADSLFTTFLLRTTDRLGIDVKVDIFEPRNFDYSGPAGCNHCGGVVSEALVQILGTAGMVLPGKIVQRATASGATLQRQIVTEALTGEARPRLACAEGSENTHDLMVVASGINRTLINIIEESGCGFKQPQGLRSFASAFRFGTQFV